MHPDLQTCLPRHKADVPAAEAVALRGWPAVEPAVMSLLEWLQDINWPVAQVLAPFFATVGADLAPYVRPVLQSQDDVWKYHIIESVVGRSMSLTQALESELRRLAQSPTPSEHAEELDRVAREALEQL